MAHEDLLAATEFFAGVSREQLTEFEKRGSMRMLVRGDVLFEEGALPEELFVVVSGRIAIASRAIDGRESVFALMEAGDLLGEMGLLDGLPRSAEARALEPSQVLAIPFEPVRSVFEADPRLLWGVVRLLVGRLRTTDDGVPLRQHHPDDLRWDGAPRADWEAFCEEWGLDRLRTRPHRWLDGG